MRPELLFLMAPAVIIAIARCFFPVPKEKPFHQIGNSPCYNYISNDFLYIHTLKVNPGTQGYEIIIWRCDLKVLKTCSNIKVLSVPAAFKFIRMHRLCIDV